MQFIICWKKLHKYIKLYRSVSKTPLKSVYFLKYSTTDSNNNNGKTIDDASKKSNSEEKKSLLEPPEEPTTCCMSGCANCVWLDYAEKLCKYYQDGGEQAIREINERISDPNIKAYILHEIRMRNKK